MSNKIGNFNYGSFSGDDSFLEQFQSKTFGSDNKPALADAATMQTEKPVNLPPIHDEVPFNVINCKNEQQLARAGLMAAAARAGIDLPSEQARFADEFLAKNKADLVQGSHDIKSNDVPGMNGKGYIYKLNEQEKSELTKFKESYVAAGGKLRSVKNPTINAQTNASTAVNVVAEQSAPKTIKVFVPLIKAEGDQSLADSALLSYVQDRYGYEKTGLFGDKMISIRNDAKLAGVKPQNLENPVALGNKQLIRFELSIADAQKIKNIYENEQARTNEQVDSSERINRNSVANKFTEGFFRGAWNDLKGNASAAYGAATDPLGTAWKIGEAILQIPTLPTKIGVGIGQAAVELSKLTPDERQNLIDELASRGYTELRDMPAAEAAERAGEIVGTLAMEAVLLKGVATGGKLTLEGLQTLKTTETGLAFIGKVEDLTNATAKTIGEVKVPVKATVESVADLNGGMRPVVVTEKKSVIELMQNMEARAKQVLSGGEKAKAINLPAWEKLSFRVDPGETKPHFLTGHEIGGSRLEQSIKAGGRKTVFPEWMSEKQITNAIKEAYNHSDKLGTQINPRTGEKIVELVGEGGGMKIKMYVNVTAKQLDSAFPLWGLK